MDKEKLLQKINPHRDSVSEIGVATYLKESSCIALVHTKGAKSVKIVQKCVYQYHAYSSPPEDHTELTE